LRGKLLRSFGLRSIRLPFGLGLKVQGRQGGRWRWWRGHCEQEPLERRQRSILTGWRHTPRPPRRFCVGDVECDAPYLASRLSSKNRVSTLCPLSKERGTATVGRKTLSKCALSLRNRLDTNSPGLPGDFVSKCVSNWTCFCAGKLCPSVVSNFIFTWTRIWT
jgi:hypothetical protein